MITEGLSTATCTFDWSVDNDEGERTPVVATVEFKGENLTISHRGRGISVVQIYTGPSSWLYGVTRYDLEDEDG